jgi:hypothetical protein
MKKVSKKRRKTIVSRKRTGERGRHGKTIARG